MESEVTLTVEVSGAFRKGTPAYFDNSFGNWLPGDPDEIIGFKVMLGDLDITSQLTEEEFERIHGEYLQAMREEA